jgi:hypothetical protein
MGRATILAAISRRSAALAGACFLLLSSAMNASSGDACDTQLLTAATACGFNVAIPN